MLFNSLMSCEVDKIATLFETCTIIFTVGTIVDTLCTEGGRTGTGIRPGACPEEANNCDAASNAKIRGTVKRKLFTVKLLLLNF